MMSDAYEELKSELHLLYQESHDISVAIKKIRNYEKQTNKLIEKVEKVLHEKRLQLQNKAIPAPTHSSGGMQGQEGVRTPDGDGDRQEQGND